VTKHLVKEIDYLKKEILSLCADVEEAVFKAVKAVSDRNAVLGQAVIEADDRIDMREVEVEEECLKILALHQPVAIDLRFIIAVLKINNDLERIADLACNIASRAISLSRLPLVSNMPFDFEDMADRVKVMLKKSIDALVNMDVNLAKEVCGSDDQIDDINRKTYQKVHGMIREDPASAESYILLLSVSKNLERIADHTTNISEDILYMISGDIIRHRTRRP
jgi:phosphate transport system protein